MSTEVRSGKKKKRSPLSAAVDLADAEASSAGSGNGGSIAADGYGTGSGRGGKGYGHGLGGGSRSSGHKRQKKSKNGKVPHVKDNTEVALESLLFGGADGLVSSDGLGDELTGYSYAGDGAEGEDEEKHREDDNENRNQDSALDDDDLFAVDTEGSFASSSSSSSGHTYENRDSILSKPSAPASASTDVRRPAWHDEDDMHIQVDVAAAPLLRKLRKTEGEAKLDGTEYVQRLREKFNEVSNIYSHIYRHASMHTHTHINIYTYIVQNA